MKLLIIGATGKTGQHIVKEALRRGHEVSVFVRNDESVFDHAKNLTICHGDVRDITSLVQAIAGKDAVIATLGAGVKRTDIRTAGNQNIVMAMQQCGVHRLITQSVLGLGDSYMQLPIAWKIIVKPMLLRNAYHDHAGQEAVVMKSPLDWTIIRPASLREVPARGVFKTGSPDEMGKITLKIGLDDLASFTLDQLKTNAYIRKTPGISY